MAFKTQALEENTERIFGKCYTLKSKNDLYYSLPEVNTMFSTEPFEIESLRKMRDELNTTKSLLNDKDIEEWRRHTKNTNPCGLVVKQLREQVNPELCTQAWAKFYEILSTCDVIPEACTTINKKLNSFHLCEAPGAFIACLNHYIKCKFNGGEGMEWTWHASTLNPFYEGNDTNRMIEGEKFLLETEEHWHFGECFDGDITNWENLAGLQQAMEINGKADIVTADGSIDCANEPEKQESIISQLLYCEVVAALTLLVPGGSLVVKLFTMFEHNTICLLYLLACCFKNIEIIKPGTSKAGNSEVYCVCTLFIGSNHLPKELFKKLRLFYTSQPQAGSSLFPENVLPASFLESIENCAKLFSEYQRDAIEKNIDQFEYSTKGKRRFLTNLRHYVAMEYQRRFNVVTLEQSSFIVPHTHLTGIQLSYWPDVKDFHYHSGYHSGCYQERMEMAHLCWQDRVVLPSLPLDSLKNENELIEDLTHDESIAWLTGSPIAVLKSDLKRWSIRLGKPIEQIQSSRFCPSALIDELHEAKSSATVLQTQQGRRWMENVEKLAQERLCPISQPHNFIDSVLRKCHLLNKQLIHCFVDISGDCRFLHEVSGSYHANRCLGLLCRNCCADSPIAESIVIEISSCLSHHNDDEVRRLSDICGEVDDGGSSVNIICGTVFPGCTVPSDYGELSSREALLYQLVIALKILRNGDSFVCEVSDTLTQFTVGVLYILHMLFKDIALFSVAGQLKCSPKQFLVCRCYVAANNMGLTEYATYIVEEFQKKQPCHKDIVCLVPIFNLFVKPFYMYLREHTMKRIKSQLHCIINLERIWLEKQSVHPISEI